MRARRAWCRKRECLVYRRFHHNKHGRHDQWYPAPTIKRTYKQSASQSVGESATRSAEQQQRAEEKKREEKRKRTAFAAATFASDNSKSDAAGSGSPFDDVGEDGGDDEEEEDEGEETGDVLLLLLAVGDSAAGAAAGSFFSVFLSPFGALFFFDLGGIAAKTRARSVQSSAFRYSHFSAVAAAMVMAIQHNIVQLTGLSNKQPRVCPTRSSRQSKTACCCFCSLFILSFHLFQLLHEYWFVSTQLAKPSRVKSSSEYKKTKAVGGC